MRVIKTCYDQIVDFWLVQFGLFLAGMTIYDHHWGHHGAPLTTSEYISSGIASLVITLFAIQLVLLMIDGYMYRVRRNRDTIR